MFLTYHTYTCYHGKHVHMWLHHSSRPQESDNTENKFGGYEITTKLRKENLYINFQ